MTRARGTTDPNAATRDPRTAIGLGITSHLSLQGPGPALLGGHGSGLTVCPALLPQHVCACWALSHLGRCSCITTWSWAQGGPGKDGGGS